MNTAVADAPAGLGRRLALWLLAAVAAYLGLTWWFGGADTMAAARRIGLPWIMGGTVLTLINFGIRAMRWHILLRALDRRVPLAVDAAVYLAGIGLSATPGKLGETVRSGFLVRHGVPVGTSLAAFVADRLSDLHAVILIALLPLAWASGWSDRGVIRWVAVLAVIACAPMALSLLVRRLCWSRVGAFLSRAESLRGLIEWLQQGIDDFVALWRPGVALWSIGASLLAYGLQAAILAGMVAQVAPQVSWYACFGIFGAATLAGAASMIPGGLGATELALVLLLGHEGLDRASALAIALCLRAVTFWFGLLVGTIGLTAAVRLQRR